MLCVAASSRHHKGQPAAEPGTLTKLRHSLIHQRQRNPKVRHTPTPLPLRTPEVRYTPTPLPLRTPEVRYTPTPLPLRAPEVRHTPTPLPLRTPEVRHTPTPLPLRTPLLLCCELHSGEGWLLRLELVREGLHHQVATQEVPRTSSLTGGA